MLVDVVMPKYGPNMLDGLLVRWLKQVGERVQKDDDLAEIETERVAAAVPAPASGVLAEILAAEGDEVPVGDVTAGGGTWRLLRWAGDRWKCLNRRALWPCCSARRRGIGAAGRRRRAEPPPAGGPIRDRTGSRPPDAAAAARGYSPSSGAPWTSRGRR